MAASVLTIKQDVKIQRRFAGHSIPIRFKFQHAPFLTQLNGLLSCNFLPCHASKTAPRVILLRSSPPTTTPLDTVLYVFFVTSDLIIYMFFCYSFGLFCSCLLVFLCTAVSKNMFPSTLVMNDSNIMDNLAPNVLVSLFIFVLQLNSI